MKHWRLIVKQNGGLLLAIALFLVFYGLYDIGMVSALLVALVVRKVFWRGASEPFLMELPTYKVPDPMNVLRNVLQRGQIFLQRMGR